MWLTIVGIVLIAAIGFVVLALAMQWREFAQKANGQSEIYLFALAGGGGIRTMLDSRKDMPLAVLGALLVLAALLLVFFWLLS